MIPPVNPLYSLNVHCCDEIGGPTPLALNTEWLLTDGMGGFAMGTVSGCATRRYHGLLVAAARPPVERFNTLVSMAETVRLGDRSHSLDCNEYLSPEHHSLFHPHGYQYLRRFEKAAGAVHWHYRIEGWSVTKELRLVWRKSAAVITYTIEPPADTPAAGELTLELLPLLGMRDFHQQRRREWGDPFHVHASNGPDGATLRVDADVPVPLYIQAPDCAFSARRDWWHNFYRRREAERGQDCLEDLFAPGAFVCTLGGQAEARSVRLYVSTEPIDRAALDTGDGREEHLRRLDSKVENRRSNVQALESPSDVEPANFQRLVAASDDFVVTRYIAGSEFRTILAGYPWFADWGRDTMISLPGLLLCTGRLEEAAQTLITFARHIRSGLVPNRFDDYGGEPHYNTVDASLWFIHACLEYRRLCTDRRVWRQLLSSACQQILRAYMEGTDGPIQMDSDGLIAAGNEQTQLTWMDAKRDGVAFTPRHGKCVEINALWHRALAGCAEAMWDEDAPAAAEYERLAKKAREAFHQTFCPKSWATSWTM